MTERKQGAELRRFRSRQDFATPPEFIAAVELRFGELAWDLAAHESNAVNGLPYFGRGSIHGKNSIDQNWAALDGNLWCNCPFEMTPAFVDKMAKECRYRSAWALLLTPSSMGSNWAKLCEENGFVIQLEDRITFVGQEEPYPKDLMLTAFGFNIVGRSRWHWDLSKTKAYERVPVIKSPKKPRKSKNLVITPAEAACPNV